MIGKIDENVIKAAGSFGGGLAATGGTCGTLLGGVALISSLYSRGNLQDKEDPRMWSLSQKFISRFSELTSEYGGIDCRDIARVEWQNKEAAKAYYSAPESRRHLCIKLVGDAAFILGELIEEEGI